MINKNNSLNKKSISEKLFYGFIFVFFTLYAILLLFPYAWGLMSSIKTPREYFNPFDLPKVVLFSNYIKALTTMSVENITVGAMSWNSVWFTFGSVIISTECHSLGGYILAKFHVKGRKFVMVILMIPLIVPIFGAFPAYYNLMHDLHLVDSYLILLTAISSLGSNTLIIMSYYDNISWTYAEAGMIDGASQWKIYWNIMRPQAKPMLLTIFLIGFIAKWNDYMSAFLYLPNKLTLATGLYKYQEVAERKGNYPIYFAASFMFVLPCIVLYSIFSKTMMENLSVGAIK